MKDNLIKFPVTCLWTWTQTWWTRCL